MEVENRAIVVAVFVVVVKLIAEIRDDESASHMSEPDAERFSWESDGKISRYLNYAREE